MVVKIRCQNADGDLMSKLRWRSDAETQSPMMKENPDPDLCHVGIFRPDSPFIPLMAARIRPSLDDAVFRSIALELLAEAPASRDSDSIVNEIERCLKAA
ncbi:hypothetical protein CerSpe_275360 [Prunus speciosa]